MSIADKIKSIKAVKENVKNDIEEVNDFITTGCLSLNVLFSGKLNGGIPVGKISQIASPSSYGKSLLGAQVARNAQKKGFTVIYVDTEYAFSKQFVKKIGISEDDLIIIRDSRIEEIQHILANIFKELSFEEQKTVLLVIDSWNNITTSKTRDDIESGKDVSDMTITKKKNSFARLLLNFRCTTFIINAVYSSMDMYSPLAISGGTGLEYVCSSIVMSSSKAQNKESSGEVSGTIITAKTVKSRLCKERSKLKYLIQYNGGIHPMYGILDDLLEFDAVIKPSKGWYQRNFELLGLEGEDKKWREKEIYNNWVEFFKPIVTNETIKEKFKNKYTFEDSDVTFTSLDDFEI